MFFALLSILIKPLLFVVGASFFPFIGAVITLGLLDPRLVIPTGEEDVRNKQEQKGWCYQDKDLPLHGTPQWAPK